MLQKIIKSRTIICVLAMLLSLGFCQIGLAAETPTVRIGSAQGSVSDTVDISINIVNASVIGAMDIELTYDANILKATNVVNGAMIESLPDALWSYNISSGKTNISLATYPDAINDDGELFIVTFDVLGVTDDTSVLAISDGLLVDTESNEISSLWFDDGITVEVPVDVTVNAPEVVTGTFDATINIADVIDLDSGQFDLSFDANVVNVIGVDSGIIGSTTVQLETCTLVDSDTVRVLFNLPGTTGISGSGSLATIHFTVTGTAGDTSVLDVSDELLVDIWAEEILSTWIDDEVTV